MSPARPRLAGLDIFRGLAVAGMILVNTPGSWSHLWWPLDHAEWHGWTPTDLVFPAFLFAVGVALALSFPRKIDGAIWLKIARRTVLLIAIGWGLQLLARPEFATFRFPGVLQRIGLCYALAASIAILTASRQMEGRRALGPAAILTTALAALLLYWALLAFVPVPGHGAGQLSPEGNLTGFVDRAVFTTAHIWRGGTDAAGNVVYDPEGLLSTISALANVLFGMLAAIAWQREPARATLRIALAGAALVAVGLLLHPILPINKKLWTSSFAIFTSGASALLLAFCMAATRKGVPRLLAPLHMLGMNAILGYILSVLVGIAGFRLFVGGRSVQDWGFARLSALIPDPYAASFAYALIALALVLAALVPFHRRGIHLRL
ncbi:acyltransferase family protein [Sphingomonas sp. Root241]|uniref:acyltransferase family protein n=1 Tax=Sphingomonas sp. Root241 TaxID=1736501 RepID=UPI000B1AB89A|nr:heparan-alpha-glucosaminide N-acetyltransferase domain-containing protein [Sphingomonas sp. Root241]